MKELPKREKMHEASDNMYETSENICEPSRDFRADLLRLAENICGKGEAAAECVERALHLHEHTLPRTQSGAEQVELLKTVRLIALERAIAIAAPDRSAEYASIKAELELELNSILPKVPDEDVLIEGNTVAALICGFAAELDDDERAVFLQRYWYFEPLSAISEKLGLGVGRVKRLLANSRRELKNYMKGLGYCQ